MSEQLHQQSILRQYSSKSGIEFYRRIMGDGHAIIHYGIYHQQQDSIPTATHRATIQLLLLAQPYCGEKSSLRILELGSGLGGSAHTLVRETAARVTCVDLSSQHSTENQATAKELGIIQNIETWTGSFESLPKEWDESFDIVWSQEAFCHAYDRAKVYSEAYRCLKPSGILAFTDIMLSEDISKEQAKSYSKINAISSWSNLSETSQQLTQCGFQQLEHEDWSHYLPMNFQRMLEQIKLHRSEMLENGVNSSFIEDFESSLTQRLNWQPGEVLCWHAIVCQKDKIQEIN